MGEFQELQPIDGLEISAVSADLYGDGRDDLALFYFQEGANFGAVYTTSKITSANINWNLKVKRHFVKALMVNTQNANAFTGVKGAQGLVEIANTLSKSLTCRRRPLGRMVACDFSCPPSPSPWALFFCELLPRPPSSHVRWHAQRQLWTTPGRLARSDHRSHQSLCDDQASSRASERTRCWRPRFATWAHHDWGAARYERRGGSVRDWRVGRGTRSDAATRSAQGR